MSGVFHDRREAVGPFSFSARLPNGVKVSGSHAKHRYALVVEDYSRRHNKVTPGGAVVKWKPTLEALQAEREKWGANDLTPDGWGRTMHGFDAHTGEKVI